MATRPLLHITYVTDPELSLEQQQRVIEGLMAAKDEWLATRIAFRLPGWSDSDVERSMSWFEDRWPDEQPLLHADSIPSAIRPAWPVWVPSRLIGAGALAASVHDADQVAEALRQGIPELIVGHIFPTDSHPGEQGRGVELLDQVRQSAPGALLTAIGGINADTIVELGRRGVDRVATIRAISRAPNIPNTLNQLYERWRESAEDLTEGKP